MAGGWGGGGGGGGGSDGRRDARGRGGPLPASTSDEDAADEELQTVACPCVLACFPPLSHSPQLCHIRPPRCCVCAPMHARSRRVLRMPWPQQQDAPLSVRALATVA